MITAFHATYFADELTKRCASDTLSHQWENTQAASKDDYSLQIANLPSAPELMADEAVQKPTASRKAKPVPKEQQELL